MARLVAKNRHQKDACYDEIGLCAQHKDTIPSSTVNTSDCMRLYDGLKKR